MGLAWSEGPSHLLPLPKVQPPTWPVLHGQLVTDHGSVASLKWAMDLTFSTDTRFELTQFHGSAGEAGTWAGPSSPLAKDNAPHRGVSGGPPGKPWALFTVE